MSSDLERSLQRVWKACLEVPQDADSFDGLDPHARRAAHDLGVRIQDRLMASLSQLTIGMTRDGIELVGDDGVPLAFSMPAGDPAATVPGTGTTRDAENAHVPPTGKD